MRKSRLCLTFKGLAVGSTLEVVNSFPSPAETPRGLTWDGQYLWHSSGYGGIIYELDTSGNIINQYNWPHGESYGMAFDGASIWVVDNSTDYVYEYSTDWNLLSSFPIPELNGIPLKGHGLTWDGVNLWLSTGFYDSENYLLKVNKAGEILENYHPLDEQLADLAWDGAYLWATSTYHNKIYQINVNGEILQTFLLQDQNPNGVTYDGNFLWYVDREPNRTIYQVQVVSGAATSSTSTTTMIETTSTTIETSTTTTTVTESFSQTIGDNDNFGWSPDAPTGCGFDKRASSEKNAVDGAQYTDWGTDIYQRRFIFNFNIPIINISQANIEMKVYDIEDAQREPGYIDIQINIEGYNLPGAFDDVDLRFTSAVINFDILNLLGIEALENICSDGIVTVDFLNAGSYRECYVIDWVLLSVAGLSGSTTTSSTTTISPQPCISESLYGEHSEQAELLRYFRDNVLLTTPEGQEIIRLYYEWSPAIVQLMRENEKFKEQVKEMADGVLTLLGGVE